MSYFIPSFFQKRILRYALSRLELLDTDALDLDKLDIVWGKKSTVELREVAINVKKFASLLELPPTLVVISAQILLLRLTVPADLNKTGILVEAEGVDVHVKAEPHEQEREERSRTKSKRNREEKRPRERTNRPRNPQTHVHDPGGPRVYQPPIIDSDDEEGSPEPLPTTTDLAKSFLQAESKDKKEELQAAIAQSQRLEESQIPTDDGDELSALGVGNTISLPGFLADFLKGVGDRVQLQVKKVGVSVSLKLDVGPENSVRSDVSDKPEIVTLRVMVQDIYLDGVSSLGSHWIRRLTFNNLEAMLISEASLFTIHARSTGPPSPEGIYSSSMEKSSHRPTRSSPQKRYQDLQSSGPPGQIDNLMVAENANDSAIQDRDLHQEGHKYIHHHNTAPAHRHYMVDIQKSQASLVQEDPGSIANSLHDNTAEHAHRALAASISLYDPSPSTSRPSADASTTHHPPGSQVSSPEVRQSSHGINVEGRSRSRNFPTSSHSVEVSRPRYGVVPISQSSSPASDDTSPGSEDLTQSKLFSHEEAESMYMSAISHASTSIDNNAAFIPGHWESSSSENEEYKGSPSHPFPIPSPLTARDIEDQTTFKSVVEDVLVPDLTTESEEQSQDLLSSLHVEGTHTPHPAGGTQRRNEKPGRASDAKPSETSEGTSMELKSSFGVKKRIINIDTIEIELPQNTIISNESTADPSSTRPNKSISAERKDSTSVGAPSIPSNVEGATTTHPLAIRIGSVGILGDMGLTRMTVTIIQQLNSMRLLSPSKCKEKQPTESATASESHTDLSIRNISWKFLDVVKGLPVQDGDSEQSGQSFCVDSDVLLRAEIRSLDASYEGTGESFVLKLSMRKFFFGYAADNILSFDPALKIRESTRDILAPKKDDIELVVIQHANVRKTNVTTLPLHFTLDLRRLDETFSWFGGLSSMLDLGNSMMSTVTVKDAAPSTPHRKKATPGVRFESPRSIVNPKPVDQTVDKITTRVGGLAFDLTGSQTSLRLESTAMKIINRVEKIGIQLDRIKLSGPYDHSGTSKPSVIVKLANLRAEYRATPKDDDLDRLVTLLSPSNDKYECDDDILLDTLLRQRSKGGIVRLTIESLDCHLSDVDDLQCFPVLIEDLKKLSTVAKYLPADDRPGMLSLILIRDLNIETALNSSFGTANLVAQNLEIAHVTFPVLIALAISSVLMQRNRAESLLQDTRPRIAEGELRPPMIMARFIGNEMEPTAKIKIFNAQFEYHVSTVMAILGYKEPADAETIVADMITSVATLTTHDQIKPSPPKLSSQSSTTSSNNSSITKPLNFDIVFRDSIIGLSPRNSLAKGLVVLTDTHFLGAMPAADKGNARLEIKKAAIMVIDDVANYNPGDFTSKASTKSQIERLTDAGYVAVSSVSAASAVIQLESHPDRAIDVEIRDDLFVLETCADSTHTLQSILDGLSPPAQPSTELKYRTEVVPVNDMLASFTGNAFPTEQMNTENDELVDDGLPLGLEEGDMVDDEVPQDPEYISSFYNPDPDPLSEGITNSMFEDDLESLAAPSMSRDIGNDKMLESFDNQTQITPEDATLDVDDDHFGTTSTIAGTAHRWDAEANAYSVGNNSKLRSSPLRIRVRDVHFIWNLFDGYDWQHTRDVIIQAVEKVQFKATERISRKEKRRSRDLDEEQEAVIGDFLFNSIYIGIQANRDPKELARQVSRDIDDIVSETDTFAISSTSGSPSKQGFASRFGKKKRPRFMRSKYHKMAFELKGISADYVVFPPDQGETQSSIDVRVHSLEIYDHLPTSTWRKFATYLSDIGERESGTNMIHLEILNVKPVPDLAASEIMLKVRFRLRSKIQD